jgi:hypothetical protein
MKYFLVCFFVSVLFSIEIYASSAYANSYPHEQYGTSKFGFNSEGAQSGSDGSRFFKNKLYDKDGRLKTNSDVGSVYNLDSNLNSQHVNNNRRGSSQDNLTRVQGQNFEADKSHKVSFFFIFLKGFLCNKIFTFPEKTCKVGISKLVRNMINFLNFTSIFIIF